MADPLWFGPPESVAALLETSDPSTIVANIAAWLSEAISHEMSMGMSLANIAATMEQWIGLGGASSALKGTELNFAGVAPMMAHCLKHVTIGQAAVEANAAARSAVIPSAVCVANRTEFAVDNSINFFGFLTPRIAELEAEYTEYWGQNSSTAAGYFGALNSLTGAIAGTPPPFTPLGASPGALATPAETVAQSAANTGVQASSGVAETAGEAAASAPADMTGQLGSVLQQGQGLISSAAGPLQQLAGAPTQGLQGISSTLTSPLQTFMGAFSSMSPSNAAAAETATAEAVGATLGGGGGGAAAGLGAGGGAGIGYSGAGLTSFTRPASTFSPETVGGRAAGLKPGGLLSAADLRGPTTTAGMGGAGIPMSPAAAGMLGRQGANAEDGKVSRARIVVDRDDEILQQS